MGLLRNNKGNRIFLIFVIILLLGLITIFFVKKKKPSVSSVVLSPDLTNHPIYSDYIFNLNDSVINIGIQPMYLPTGIIMEVIKRDNILNKALGLLGKQINYYSFLKGADVNFFLVQKILDGGVGGDMPALSIAFVYDVVIPVILQKGNVSIISDEPMLSDDLIGKRIAYPYGSISHYFILELMHSSGITEDMVQLIPMDVTSMAMALHNHEIDLFSAWEPIVSSAVKQYPEFHITYAQITTGYFYFTNTFVQKDPKVTELILAAVIRSISWMKSDNENLLLACEWNLQAIEKLTGEENVLSKEEIAELAKADLIGYHSKYSVVIKDNYLRKNSSLYNEYKFLSGLDEESEKYNWEKVSLSFDNNLIVRILEHPKEFRLKDYDYELESK